MAWRPKHKKECTTIDASLKKAEAELNLTSSANEAVETRVDSMPLRAAERRSGDAEARAAVGSADKKQTSLSVGGVTHASAASVTDTHADAELSLFDSAVQHIASFKGQRQRLDAASVEHGDDRALTDEDRARHHAAEAMIRKLGLLWRKNE